MRADKLLEMVWNCVQGKAAAVWGKSLSKALMVREGLEAFGRRYAVESVRGTGYRMRAGQMLEMVWYGFEQYLRQCFWTISETLGMVRGGL